MSQEEARPLVGPGAQSSGDGMSTGMKACCGCLCCTPFLLVIVVWFGLKQYITGMATSQFVDLDETNAQEYCQQGHDMKDLAYNIWWPGYGYVSSLKDFSSESGSPCYKDRFLKGMAAFNAKMPFKLVHYKSRKAKGFETVKLAGWWLPADTSNLPKGAVPPRIVLQHGFRDNSNTFRTQSIAYILRTMGFDVLINNFRDHCYSDNATHHVYEWGNSYPYDLLGAWDYAVADPDGMLGGSVEKSKVGLMGYSKGGFIVGSAFGLEKDVPAVWIDSAPLVPKSVFAHGLSKTLGGMGLGFLSGLLAGPVWGNVESYAKEKGIDINFHTPASTLPKGPNSGRSVYVVHNKKDSTVPFSEGEGLIALIKKYPKKYDLAGTYFTDGYCESKDSKMDHIIDQLLNEDEYKSRLCKYWSSVFGTKEKTCGLPDRLRLV